MVMAYNLYKNYKLKAQEAFCIDFFCFFEVAFNIIPGFLGLTYSI